MPKAPQPLEKVIQKQIMDWLRLRGWFVERMNSGKIPIPGVKGRMVRLHTEGCPDVLALRRSPDGLTTDVLFVEVKRPGNKPTEIQLAMHEQIRAKTGATVIVATGYEDVERQLS